ncbi:MAG: O-antigen ligase family protein [Sedimentisphaerales bacterium]|nr:O-antigen ligase family protein [Sedimentisphaerales bacterium]
MKKITNNHDVTKSKALMTFEYVLLVFYLAIIILRVLYTEGPTMQTSSNTLMASDSVYSLYISGALLFSFFIWLAWSLCSKSFSYKVTGIEIGLLIFGAAAVISYFAASDKRLAINNIISLFVPIFSAILLVQILDSNIKIRLVLAVIAAMGVVSAYQCADQLLFLNKETIKQYEDNPDMTLETLNINKGTLQHFLFEQRLHSNNASAFFTTRNSAGSFFLIAIFVLFALTIESENPAKLKAFFIVLLFAIFITKSKGAIFSFFFAFTLIGLYQKYSDLFRKHRKIILILSILLIVAGTSLIASYGIKHQTLPGGISMLVRWQYWEASAKMFIDNFWTGVGPGNFSNYYSHYKPAQALESVTDPHNFPLSLLTQYGIFGLVGFLLMIFLPLWNSTKGNTISAVPTNNIEKNNKLMGTILNVILCVLFGLVLCKIKLTEAFKSGNVMVIIYLMLRLCIPPIAVFSVSLYFIRKYTYTELDNERNVIRKNGFAVIILCALLGFLLHNLTDFAIFEPGIYTTFWSILAVLIAVNANNKNRKSFVFTPATYIKIPAVLGTIVIFFAFLIYALIPVASSTKKIKLANESFSHGDLQQAYQLLDSAAENDKLSGSALSLNARMFVYNAERTPSQRFEMLLYAEECFRKAIERNSASYKNYEDLSQTYVRHSEISNPDETAGWLTLALDAAIQAKDRYQGNERLHFNLALISDKLVIPEKAIESYQNAVNIEDQYRSQFKKMYPNKELVSRLGEEKYEFAKQRITEITSQNDI